MSKSHNKNAILDSDNIFELLMKLSFPMMVGSLMEALYNTVDSIFVGHYVGSEAIAALTVNNPIQMLQVAVGAMMSVGTGVLISQSLGAKNYRMVNTVLINGLSLSFGLSLILSWSMLFFLDQMLLFLGSAQSFLSHTRDYAGIILWTGFVPSVNALMSGVLRAKGLANLSMILISAGALINIGLDALFIIRFGWGVKGAALATMLSQIVVLGLSFYFMFKNYAIKSSDFRHASLDRSLMSQIVMVGLPTGLRLGTFSLMSFVANRTLQSYGTVPLAAYGIVNRIVNLAFMPIFGCNLGVQPIISFNFGAKRYDRIVKALKVSISVSSVIALIGSIVFVSAPAGLFQMFTTDPQTIYYSRQAARIMGSLFFLFGCQMIIVGMMQSTDHPKAALFLSVSRPLVHIVGFLTLPMWFGLKGIWMTLPVADFINFTLAVIMLRIQLPLLKTKLQK